MDRDQAPLNVGPDLRSILFDNRYHVCFAWNDVNSEDIEICQFYKCPRTFGGYCIYMRDTIIFKVHVFTSSIDVHV